MPEAAYPRQALAPLISSPDIEHGTNSRRRGEPPSEIISGASGWPSSSLSTIRRPNRLFQPA